jgi:uncharacterized membrane protein
MFIFGRKRKYDRRRAIRRTLGLGAITGMRALSGLALLSRDAAYREPRGRADLTGTSFALLKSRRAAGVLTVMAAAEMVNDKLPNTPNRIESAPLLCRALCGAVVGAAAFAAEDEAPALGAAAGLAAAVLAAFAAFHLRRRISQSKVVPDPLLGLAEDAVVIGAGMRVLDNGPR